MVAGWGAGEVEEALEKMRDWVRRHPDIRHCRTDDGFLLRFLRARRFSVVQAQEMLERYLIIRKLYPQWFTRLDPDDRDIAEIIDSGYLFPLGGKDREGRVVLFSCAGRFDPARFTSAQLVKVHSIVTESVMDDEASQLKGINHVNDESGITLGHFTIWSLADMKNVMKTIQKSCPVRHKVINFINVPSAASRMLEFVSNLMSDKLRKRVKWHASTQELKDQMDLSILPKEYGGEVPMDQLIGEFKSRLAGQREWLLALDSLDIDLDSRRSRFLGELEPDDVLSGLAGSFRKLQVD